MNSPGRLLTALWMASAAAVAQDEVPFVTTPDAVTAAMLEIAAVGPRDHVIDLGSGDGRIVITAARRFGATAMGVEIVPDLVRTSRARAAAEGVGSRVEFREQDLFSTDLAKATVVTMYLLPDVNLQLRPRLLQMVAGTRIVSHDWDMGDWAPDRTRTVAAPDKAIGLDKSSRVHLWVVPVRADGLWCGDGARLEITQRFQRFSATLWDTASNNASTVPVVFDGRIDGTVMHRTGAYAAPMTLTVLGPTLRIEEPMGPSGGAARGFVRAQGSSCR